MRALPAFISLLALTATQAPPAPSIEGHWINPSGSVTVAIAPCGAALCGTVIAASDKAKADARKGGTNELIGTLLLSNFVPDGNTKWKGKIFVPDLNVRSRATLQQTGPTR